MMDTLICWTDELCWIDLTLNRRLARSCGLWNMALRRHFFGFG